MSQIPELMGGRSLSHDLTFSAGKGVRFAKSGRTAQNRQLYVNVAASAEHENTTDEALFDQTYTIPADSLEAGQRIRIGFQGIVTDNNSTDTLQIKLYIGGLSGTALITLAATDVADNDVFSGEMTLHIRTTGASGTFVGHGWSSDFTSASSEAVVREYIAETAINTTIAQVIGVGADWSVAHADNECRLDILTVEVLG